MNGYLTTDANAHYTTPTLTLSLAQHSPWRSSMSWRDRQKASFQPSHGPGRPDVDGRNHLIPAFDPAVLKLG